MKTKEIMPERRRGQRESEQEGRFKRLRNAILDAEFLLEMAGDNRFVIKKELGGWTINVQ